MKNKLFKLDKEHFHVYNEYAKTKLQYTWFKKLIFSILGGFFIGIGYVGMLAIIAYTNDISEAAKIALKLAGACMFPVGLLMCIYLGGNLFTSNCMGVIATVYRDKTIFAYFRDLMITFIGNMIGSFLIATICWGAGIFGPIKELSKQAEYIINMAMSKIDVHHMHSWWNNMLSGILCNILVVGAIIVSLNTKKKGVGAAVIYLMLVVFVLSGYQHVVANMYIFSQAGLMSIFGTTAETTFTGQQIAQIFYINIIPSAVGNLIGGIIMSLVYLIASSYVFTRKHHNCEQINTIVQIGECDCKNDQKHDLLSNNQNFQNSFSDDKSNRHARFLNVHKNQKPIIIDFDSNEKLSIEECYTIWKKVAGYNQQPVKCSLCSTKNKTTIKTSNNKNICYYCWIKHKTKDSES